MVQVWRLSILAILLPQVKKNLISTHRLAMDNFVFLEVHPKYFLVKDRATRNTILRGKCQQGLYSLPSASTKQVFLVKPSFSRWHSHLGHPSTPVVAKVLSKNNLPCLSKFNKESVCDACQKAKSHQLPYSSSSSVSHHPLKLIFSNVWGLAPSSASGKKYYVSFIDDYSKFTWIYLLKNNSEVFEKVS